MICRDDCIKPWSLHSMSMKDAQYNCIARPIRGNKVEPTIVKESISLCALLCRLDHVLK